MNNDDDVAMDQNSIRRTDTNSLLRLYDRAQLIRGLRSSQYERARAERVLRRVAEELQKRNVSVGVADDPKAPVKLLKELALPGG
jgi:hypothetical protein